MNCKYHPDRPSTHVVDVWTPPLIPVCDECAEAEREIGGLKVVPIIEQDDVLDAEVIDG